uniref:Potassium channel domain-containing protein n=1 Tax=Ditylenchus dipsaci TaxID=166011 RepID=A0A915DWL8_9BILA
MYLSAMPALILIAESANGWDYVTSVHFVFSSITLIGFGDLMVSKTYYLTMMFPSLFLGQLILAVLNTRMVLWLRRYLTAKEGGTNRPQNDANQEEKKVEQRSVKEREPIEIARNATCIERSVNAKGKKYIKVQQIFISTSISLCDQVAVGKSKAKFSFDRKEKFGFWLYVRLFQSLPSSEKKKQISCKKSIRALNLILNSKEEDSSEIFEDQNEMSFQEFISYAKMTMNAEVYDTTKYDSIRQVLRRCFEESDVSDVYENFLFLLNQVQPIASDALTVEILQVFDHFLLQFSKSDQQSILKSPIADENVYVNALHISLQLNSEIYPTVKTVFNLSEFKNRSVILIPMIKKLFQEGATKKAVECVDSFNLRNYFPLDESHLLEKTLIDAKESKPLEKLVLQNGRCVEDAVTKFTYLSTKSVSSKGVNPKNTEENGAHVWTSRACGGEFTSSDESEEDYDFETGNIAARFLNNPFFQQFVAKLRPSYKLPSRRYKFSKTLVPAELNRVKKN